MYTSVLFFLGPGGTARYQEGRQVNFPILLGVLRQQGWMVETQRYGVEL